MELRQDRRSRSKKTGFWLRCRVLLGLGCSALIMLGGTLLILLIGCVTLFRARRLYSEVLVKWMARAGLWCCGIKFLQHRDFELTERQTVYISNHTSSLDMLVLTAVGLPRTRYFLSGFLRRIIPIGVIGYVMGVFWTALQKYPEKRTRLFQHAERTLRHTGESVFLTPEGQQIGCFNKGAFHLATNLSAPIQPIFINIPDDVDPGPWTTNKNLDLRPGRVDIYFKPPIDTANWMLKDLEANRDSVRDFYTEWQEELAAANVQSTETEHHQPSRVGSDVTT